MENNSSSEDVTLRNRNSSNEIINNNNNSNDDEKALKETTRNSSEDSLRNRTRNNYVIRRTQSYEPNMERSRIKARRSNTMKILMSYLLSTSPKLQLPTPLLVEDPPSSCDGSDLEDVKVYSDPALLNGSSSNFGSAGVRSAPGTPQGVIGASLAGGGLTEPPLSQPCSPGCTSPSIQRSPSHSLFTKCDKASLKLLSTSTPAMTAQAQLTEPPSPKTVKEAKTPTTSKARQKKFNRHFPSVADEEKVLNHYSCALIGDILLQGHLYITKNYFAFYSNVFGYVTKLLIPMLSVDKISKEKTAKIIPNAVGISTTEDKHVFGSLMSRDNTYRFMVKVWELAKDASPLIVEPEIVEPVPVSDSDSSETREGESGRESPIPDIATRLPHFKPPCKENVIHKNTTLETQNSLDVMNTLKQGISKFASLPRQSLILFATTLLLILLFLSAAVLLYRISKIQNKYSYTLQDNVLLSDSEDIYNNLLQWQTQLHSKSAGAVHNFLDSNLDQIAKVRQSLEALSTLLVPINSPTHDTNSKQFDARDSS